MQIYHDTFSLKILQWLIVDSLAAYKDQHDLTLDFFSRLIPDSNSTILISHTHQTFSCLHSYVVSASTYDVLFPLQLISCHPSSRAQQKFQLSYCLRLLSPLTSQGLLNISQCDSCYIKFICVLGSTSLDFEFLEIRAMTILF